MRTIVAALRVCPVTLWRFALVLVATMPDLADAQVALMVTVTSAPNQH